jgi:citrate lyase subunit beta / citryl-CoA lyase
VRSLLVAPPDERRLAEALKSDADAIVVDLDRITAAQRAEARMAAAAFLRETRARGGTPTLIVRIHPLDSGEADSDLDAVITGVPDAILLPGSLGAQSVQQLSAKLAVREAHLGLSDGATRIIAVAKGGPSLFDLGSYGDSSARLLGLAWSAGFLAADIGADASRDGVGEYMSPYRLARDLTLFAAASARVVAIDAPFTNLGDLQGLGAEARDARRDGFSGKIAVDRAQVAIINDVFARRTAPGAQEI